MALAAMAAGSAPAQAAASPPSSFASAQTAAGATALDAAAEQGRRVCRRVVLPSGQVVTRCRWVISAVSLSGQVDAPGLR
jgi:hypothetical protein